jgi:branched-subunit amino acid aminotransferase/4-amino-4-deoxychorismate lyase
MSFDNGPFIWFDGKFVRWEEATIHVMRMCCTGSSAFEAFALRDGNGPVIFAWSARPAVASEAADRAALVVPGSLAAIQETGKWNGQPACYIRPPSSARVLA